MDFSKALVIKEAFNSFVYENIKLHMFSWEWRTNWSITMKNHLKKISDRKMLFKQGNEGEGYSNSKLTASRIF